MKRYIANSILLFASLLICAIGVELVARKFVELPSPYPAPPGTIVFDKKGFWAMEPNRNFLVNNSADIINKSIQILSNSARHTPCGYNTTANAKKIFLIGDSQTFGWGLSNNETWANHLQCMLSKVANNPPKVINLGVPGTQVDQYIARGFAQVAPAVNTGDIVIISITWNDLVGFFQSPTWIANYLRKVGLKQIPTNSQDLKVTRITHTSIIKSNLSVRKKIPVQFEPRKPNWILNPPTWRYKFYKNYGFFVPSVNSFGAIHRSLLLISAAYRFAESRARIIYYRIRPSNSLFDKVPHGSYQGNFLALKALSYQLEKYGAKVLIQLLPNKLFFDDYYYASYSKNGVVFPARNYMSYIASPFCKSLELKCVDRFYDLKTSTRDEHNLVYDGHYNEIAAAKIGQALAKDINYILKKDLNVRPVF